MHTFLRAKREAQALIKKYRITKPDQIDIEAIAALNKIYFVEDELHGAEASLQLCNDNGLVTIRKDIPERGRKRFALSHEIGHFLLHKSKKSIRECSEKEFLQWYIKSDEEPEANMFAAELLLPESIFSPLCQGLYPDFDKIRDLAEEFRASLTATAYRYVEVGNFPCALIAVRQGRIAWYKASHDFNYYIRKVGSEINRNTASGEYFNTGNLTQDKPECVDIRSWLEVNEYNNGISLYESTVLLGSYQTTLSLIYIN